MTTLEQGKAIASAIGKAISSLYVKKEIAQLDSKIAQLIDKKAELSGKAIAKADKQSNAKSKANVSCEKSDLIIDVAANVQVKDICRNIERKLQRNLSSKSEDDKQMLYNHLFYFYSLKHINSLPIVHGKNKDYHINDYVAQRTNSVINDVTCHINFK
jgi:hypothetical protein